MKTAHIDFTGKTFGRWTVVARSSKTRPCVHWVCRCDCGAQREVSVYSLTRGISRACRTCAIQTHGMKNSPEWRAWQGMKERCHNPRNRAWVDYGGRGISVCQEWRDSFQAFYDHVGSRPSNAHEIDRIDNSRGYHPGNVRWVTLKVQANNRRCCHMVTISGRTQTIQQWCDELRISRGKLRYRIAQQMPLEELLNAG